MRPVAGRNPNRGLIGTARGREQLATPALVLDLDAFERNLSYMTAYCTRHGMALRPHAKTHKSVRIAREQHRAGAVGTSVATLREAAVMVGAGLTGVLLTSPLAGAVKLEALVQLLPARGTAPLTVAVDSLAAARALEGRLKRARKTVPVLMDLDPGMKRTGVRSTRDALALARHLACSDVLQFRGVQYYSGMVQHIGRVAARARIYRSQLQHLERILTALQARGLPATIVSGGGTGTFALDCRSGLFTECQAGSYIFMDRQYNDVELMAGTAHPFETALYVQATVISANHAGRVTLDTGFKSFAMDGPPPAAVGTAGRSRFQFYGDEFAVLSFPRGQRTPALGSRVEFVTPHCDPTVNLHSFYHCVRGQRLVDIWHIDARGSL